MDDDEKLLPLFRLFGVPAKEGKLFELVALTYRMRKVLAVRERKYDESIFRVRNPV